MSGIEGRVTLSQGISSCKFVSSHFKAGYSNSRMKYRYKLNIRQLDCLCHHFNISEQEHKKPGTPHGNK